MRKHNSIAVILLGFCILQTACNKEWLDIKPNKNITTPATLADFEALMDYDEFNFSALAMGEVASDGHYLSDIYHPYLDDILTNIYTWTNTRPYAKVTEWNAGYRRILNANIANEGLEKIKTSNGTSAQWNRIKGNVLFQRARFFFELAQIYAPPYDKATANKDLSIPLQVIADITIKPKRSTVNETYDQILSDLMLSKDLLPVTPQYKTRGSKVAVYALLSNVYLCMGDYAQSKLWADAALNISHDLIDYNTLPSSSSTDFNGLLNKEMIFYSFGSGYLPLLTPSYGLVDLDLYKLYADNDLRKTRFLKRNPDLSISFIGNYGSNLSGTQFMGLATDEIYLVRAECNARLGRQNEAMDDLNALLITRWKTGTFVPFTATSASDALRQVLQERKKELLFRGRRWSDLRRLNKEEQFKTTLTRTVKGITYTLEPNSYKYTFPIPDDEIQLSGIAQNPGWK
jgi:tetratricopeptide (TPR) repeat protein